MVTGLCALGGAPPRLTWSLLLVIAMLAARFVPGVAIDVPDQYLIDLERLAVTAWSARERAGGKRGRSVVPSSAVSAVATRGTRIVTAASTAVLVVAVLAAPLLLATATLPVDRIGARCLVGFAGAALLLAARSYRHRAARSLLRTAGLGCWAALLVVLLRLLDDQGRWIARGERDRARRRGRAGRRRDRPGLALGLVVATGRGRRGTVRRAGPRRLVVASGCSASCGRSRACGNSVLRFAPHRPG